MFDTMLLVVRGKDKRRKVSMSIAIGNITLIHVEDACIFFLSKENIQVMKGRSLDDCEIVEHRMEDEVFLYEMKNFYMADFTRG